MCNLKTNKKTINFGTLNVRGLKKNIENVYNDMKSYDLDLCAIQETHDPETENLLDNNNYVIYTTNEDKNRYHGVGIIARKNLNPVFNRISNRICTATVNLKDKTKVLFISAYAHTQATTRHDPTLRDKFYQDLRNVVSSQKSNTLIITAGDFNAKTGEGHKNFPENIGKFGKGNTNENGEALLEFSEENNLFITNTKFRHKMCNRTTWTAPFRNFKMSDGRERKNPVRNQIDYILVNKPFLRFVKNSRSYGGINTETDHKLVKMILHLQLYKLPKVNQDKSIKQIQLDNFAYIEKRNEYKEKLEKLERETDFDSLNSESAKWEKIVELCKQAGLETLGEQSKNQAVKDPEIHALSSKSQILRRKIESLNDETQKIPLKKERRIIKKQIQKKLKEYEEKILNDKLEKLEQVKNDSNKYYQVLRDINSNKVKKTLLVTDNKGKIAGATAKKLEIIKEHFQNALAPNEMENEFKTYEPCKMKNEFTADEIKKAVKTMKNGKSCGIDKLNAEYIKYAPTSIHQHIANIYNRTAETGEPLEYLVKGLLTPLQKPGKKKGPAKNLRPIIFYQCYVKF